MVKNEADVGIAQSVNSTETDGVIDPSGKVTHDNIVHLPDHLKGVYKESIAPKPVSAIDSHFHLDRTLAALGLSPKGSLEDALRATSVDEGEEITIGGAVAVYCDPSTFPSVKTLKKFSDGLVVAVGVHPKNVSQASDAHVHTLQALLKTTRVRALGEIGLDRSAPPKE